MIYHAIEDLIGNTPLLQIDSSRYGIKNVDIYIKCEYMNPFGSVKDRTALSLVRDLDFAALRDNHGQLIESSSGNTAKALQMLALRNSISLVTVTNRIKIPEVSQLLRYLGSDIVSLPGRSECPDPNDPDNALAVIERMVAENPDRYHHTSQYTNADNPRAHETTTAVELFNDLPNIDYFVTGVGTGGSSGGVIDYIRNHNLSTNTIGVVSHPSDFLPGIRSKAELFETPLFHEDHFVDLAEITSHDALAALDQLVRNEGVMAGPTTGGNFAATLDWCRAHDELRPDGTRTTLVMIACDRLEPYMSYLEKRLPDRFGKKSYDDLYGVEVAEDIDISVNDLAAQLASEQPPLVIDTRGVKAYGLFHIEESICYPEEILHELLETDVPFSGRSIVFVCPRGDRSQRYASILRARGLEAYSLESGLMAWRSAGQPLIKKV